MSEETEGQDTGCEAEGGLNPVAVALALGGASREKADAFLDDQRALIADQRHHLHEQFKHLHLSVWEKQLGVLLRLATAIVGFAVAIGTIFMVDLRLIGIGMKRQAASVLAKDLAPCHSAL